MDYMAPEQIRGEPVSAATDIYALGCVMYECMCGRPPFAEVQGMRILWAHLQDAPPDPRSVRADIPDAFCAGAAGRAREGRGQAAPDAPASTRACWPTPPGYAEPPEGRPARRAA